MPTISGVWKWNDTVNLTMGILEFQISVTIDGTEYQTILTSGTSIGGTPKDSSDNVYFNFNGGWVKSAYKVWDFGTSPQTIDQELYTFITTNAQQAQKSISLANLQTFKNNCDTAYEPRKNIPTPTTANNGQVLGVTNGVYAFTEGGGVGIQNVEIVDAEQSGNTNAYEYSYVVNLGTIASGANTLSAEICSLLCSYKCVGVIFNLTVSGGSVTRVMPRTSGDGSENAAEFSTTTASSQSITTNKLTVMTYNNSANYSTSTTSISSTKKYLHNIRIINSSSTMQMWFSFISTSSNTIIQQYTLASEMFSNGYSSLATAPQCSGVYSGTIDGQIVAIYASNTSTLNCVYINSSNNVASYAMTTVFSLNDKVIEL